MSKRRLFLGFPVDVTISHALIDQVKDYIDETMNCLKWTMDNDFHITSHFIGDVTDAECQVIQQNFLCMNLPTLLIECKIVSIELFRQHDSQLLAAIIQPNARLTEIQQLCNQHLAKLGFNLENKPYQPHLTLARGSKCGEILPIECSESLKLREFSLYESKITSSTSKYKRLEAHILS